MSTITLHERADTITPHEKVVSIDITTRRCYAFVVIKIITIRSDTGMQLYFL